MEAKYIYQGYQSENLDQISLKNIKAFQLYLMKHLSYYQNTDFNRMISSLKSIPFSQVQELSKRFLEEHFQLHSISYLSVDEMKSHVSFIGQATSTKEFYGRVNSILTMISPYDLPVKLVDGHSMTGQIVKPLIFTPEGLTEEGRKVYFSHIEIGRQLSLLSASTLVHEIAHSQLESNIGYTNDFLNKEIISIFLEKVAAYEMDPTGNILRVSENIRSNDFVVRYVTMMNPNISEKTQLDCLLYLKSILFAQKLFDLYLNECKYKIREKFFDDIQLIFDGKMIVDEFISKRNITYSQCLDFSLLERRMGK